MVEAQLLLADAERGDGVAGQLGLQGPGFTKQGGRVERDLRRGAGAVSLDNKLGELGFDEFLQELVQPA